MGRAQSRVAVALPCLISLFFTVLAPAEEQPALLIRSARSQIGVTTRYDGSYQRLLYPGGDVPADRGVCTDVLIRAFRAMGLDLQVLVHEDIRANWQAYPKIWGLTKPDRNIDHRRVPNLAAFFSRKGSRLEVTRDPRVYAPGDIVTWRLPGNLPHIGLVSDAVARGAVPLIIHNIGAGTAEEDILFSFPVTGHFRYFPSHPRGQERRAP